MWRTWALFWAGVLMALVAIPVAAQVSVAGRVHNETTGKPASRVALTLVRFVGGMSPVEETLSGPDGRFAFEKTIPSSGAQPMLGMVRAEYDGVPYSALVRRGSPTTNLQVTVYSVEERDLPDPDDHIVFFEPGGSEMVVNESFGFLNSGQPPRAFRNPDRGTVRFWLPEAAKGVVQVMTSGPLGVRVKGTAEPTGEENVYKVDYAIKPGENRVDVTYLVPHADGDTFRGALLYDGLATNVVAPEGVSVEGDSLSFLRVEPRTQASLYRTQPLREYVVTVTGQGRLSGPAAEGGGGGGGSMRVAAAPIAEELIWILSLTGCIFAVGFCYLYTSREEPQLSSGAGAQAAGVTPRSVKGSKSSSSRRKR